MKDLSLIVDVLMWILVSGLAFYILCLIIYYAVHRKSLPCIEDEHRKLKPKDVDGLLNLVSTPMDHENVFMKMYKEGRETLPTLRECVKICEENPEICEMLAYLQKEKEKEDMKNNEMPELQFGDVVKWATGDYGLVGDTEVWDLKVVDGIVTTMNRCMERRKAQTSPAAMALYRGRSVLGFNQPDLRTIVDGKGKLLFEIWERPKVREMTVEQISKELGYTVKVIGDK